jgi:hypothetical protein
MAGEQNTLVDALSRMYSEDKSGTKGIFDNLLEVANLDSPGFDLPISLKGRWILRNLWRWKVYHLNA